MEFAVLGLLLIRPMTIYELNTAFKQSISLIFSASYGSLQSAIKKLLEKGYIIYEESVHNSRNKKVYIITKNGTEAFFHWIHEDTPKGKLEAIALTKLHFLGLVENAAERRTIIDKIIAPLEEVIGELEDLEKQAKAYPVPQEYQNIYKYPRKTLEYGLMAHRAALVWFLELRAELQRE